MIRGQSTPYHWFGSDSIPAASRHPCGPERRCATTCLPKRDGSPACCATARRTAPCESDNGDSGTGPTDDSQPRHRTRPVTRRGGHRQLAIFLIDLPPNDMERRLGDALSVYVDAMRYPRGTENQRAAMWLEHVRRRGWQGVAVVEAEAANDPGGQLPPAAELSDAPLLGVAYGYP